MNNYRITLFDSFTNEITNKFTVTASSKDKALHEACKNDTWTFNKQLKELEQVK